MTELLRERYELLEVEGQGGEGRVVRALDHQHERLVALKIRTVGSDSVREELLSEARILLEVPPHPNLPLVREDFFDGDDYVIAMDWVDGIDLARLLHAQGRPGLAPSLVLRWLADAAAALTHLHTQDPPVIHGDVKPANLVLTKGGRVTLVDFGLSSAPSSPRRRGGTRGYAAPELVSSTPDRRSDIYSLAATAFALLTGGPPTGIRPAWEGIDPSLAAELEDVIRGGLATDPVRRPEAAGELVERLQSGWGATLPTGVLTFCLTDIEGSTAKWDAHPAEMARALVAHDERIAAAVETAGGRFLKSMGEGDATVSVFDAPAAALDAAIAITRAVSKEHVGGETLRARVALHTGEAEQRGADYFGPTLNLAARLRGLADGGQIFLSRTTGELVGRHLPGGVGLVDLGPHRLRGVQAAEQVFAVTAPGVDTPPLSSDCPYPGLLSFEPGDRERFFGRERVVADLVERVTPGRFVAVVGSSGSGKSSVLRAGVAARIGGMLVVTPGRDPVAAIAGVGQGKPVVIDQLEELFTQCDDEGARAMFIEALLAREGPVVVGLRADFYGACATHPGLAAAVAADQVLLGPMQESELRRAITEPARLAGLRLEPGLVDVLVAEVQGEPGALPLLSHALRATWERRENRTLTLDAYRATGGVRGAIAATADRALASLDVQGRDLARQVFLRLVEPGEGLDDTSRRARLDELTPASDEGAALSGVLATLAAARLVTVGTDGVEVAHEALIREWPQLQSWLDEGRDELRVQRHLTAAATSWDAAGREPTELYRGPRLAAALDSRAGAPHLSALERDFLEASREDSERAERARAKAHRRTRALLTATVVGLIIAVIGGSLALVQSRRATSARDRADVARLAAESRALVQRQPDVGLLVAAEAYRRRQDSDTRSALLSGVETHPLLEGLLYGVNSGLEAAVFTPDGKLVVTPTSDGSGTLLWDTRSRRQVGALRHGRDLALGAAVSPDGRWLAVAAVTEAEGEPPSSSLQVWDLPARRLDRIVPSPGGLLTSAWFSADGRTLVTQGGPRVDGPFPMLAVVWDAATWTAGPLWQLAEDYVDDDVIVLSPDGRLLALPQADGTVAVWTVADRRPLPTIAPDVAHVTALAFNADGTTLAVTGESGRVALLDPQTGTPRRPPLVLGTGVPSAMEFSRDGRLLAVSHEDGSTQLFDVPTGEALGPALQANASAVNDVSFSADGTRMATAGLDRTGALWRLDGSRSIATPLADHSAAVTEVHYTPDGRLLVTAGADGRVVVRDVAAGRVRHVLDVGGEALTVALDATGRRAAAAGTRGPVRVFDLATGAPVAELDVGDSWVHQVAFNPASGELAVALDNSHGTGEGGEPAQVLVWDPSKGEPTGSPISEAGGSPIALAWRPDGRQLAVAMDNNVIGLYDRISHRRVGRAIESPDAVFSALAFSPDGQRLATGAFSGLVLQWSTATHRQVGPALEGHSGAVAGVAYSPDGRLLASTTLGFGATRLWDSATGAALGAELTAGRTPFTVRNFLVEHFLGSRPAFTPDGTHLATAGFDGLTTVWDLRPQRWHEAACAVAGRQLTKAEWAQHVSPKGSPRAC